ncbi:MAG: ATP-binding protein [bacterium]|nr:ATP-binding protein [bacterium]
MTMPSFKSMWMWPEEEKVSSAHIESMVSSAIREIYRHKDISLYVMSIILGAFGEAIANASEHGNQSQPSKKIVVRCFFGQKGVIFSFHDEGNFFKQLKNKKAVESRTILPSTKKVPSGGGMALIYNADEIFVSTRQNTLYLVFTDVLNKKKGENESG